MVRFGAGVESSAEGAQYPRLCAGCHDPVSARAGDTSLTKRARDHVPRLPRHRAARSGGRQRRPRGARARLDAVPRGARVGRARHAARSALLRRVPRAVRAGNGDGGHRDAARVRAEPVLGSGRRAGHALRRLPRAARGGRPRGPRHGRRQRDHPPGVAGDGRRGDDQRGAKRSSSRPSASRRSARFGSEVVVTVRNRGAGHSFPTGVTDIREPWVELEAVDAQHAVVARYGGPAADGTIPADAAPLRDGTSPRRRTGRSCSSISSVRPRASPSRSSSRRSRRSR